MKSYHLIKHMNKNDDDDDDDADADDGDDQDIGFEIRGYWVTFTICLSI